MIWSNECATTELHQRKTAMQIMWRCPKYQQIISVIRGTKHPFRSDTLIKVFVWQKTELVCGLAERKVFTVSMAYDALRRVIAEYWIQSRH